MQDAGVPASDSAFTRCGRPIVSRAEPEAVDLVERLHRRNGHGAGGDALAAQIVLSDAVTMEDE
jgi:hypothetical protein